MTETRKLTGKQTALVDCLVNTGVTITQAAKTVGMTREGASRALGKDHVAAYHRDRMYQALMALPIKNLCCLFSETATGTTSIAIYDDLLYVTRDQGVFDIVAAKATPCWRAKQLHHGQTRFDTLTQTKLIARCSQSNSAAIDRALRQTGFGQPSFAFTAHLKECPLHCMDTAIRALYGSNDARQSLPSVWVSQGPYEAQRRRVRWFKVAPAQIGFAFGVVQSITESP